MAFVHITLVYERARHGTTKKFCPLNIMSPSEFQELNPFRRS